MDPRRRKLQLLRNRSSRLPPFTDIRSVQTLVEGDKLDILYGGQDLSVHDSGAYTGEISGAFLSKLGATFVLVGHSERRTYHHESDELCAAKVQAAYKHGLTPVLCVGEPLEVREAGTHVEYTLEQLRGSIAGLTAEQAETLVVAYEPVWAIGTGKVATAEDAQEMSAAIRAEIAKLYSADVAEKVRVLYGGSGPSPPPHPPSWARKTWTACSSAAHPCRLNEFAAIARFDA